MLAAARDMHRRKSQKCHLWPPQHDSANYVGKWLVLPTLSSRRAHEPDDSCSLKKITSRAPIKKEAARLRSQCSGLALSCYYATQLHTLLLPLLPAKATSRSRYCPPCPVRNAPCRAGCEPQQDSDLWLRQCLGLAQRGCLSHAPGCLAQQTCSTAGLPESPDRLVPWHAQDASHCCAGDAGTPFVPPAQQWRPTPQQGLPFTILISPAGEA